MTTTNTYAFSPALSQLVLGAFARIGTRGAEITPQHMRDAEFESNLLLCEMANRQPNLWSSYLQPVSLVAGTATYTLDPQTVAIQAAYITTTSNGVSADRLIFPVSTVDYAAYPNKTTQSPPTVYWFNRQITPQITMYPVPDSAATYVLNLRVVRQLQDASLPGGLNVEIPYRWNDAFTAGLAARLAALYKPDMVQMLDAKAERSWLIAATQDQEDVPMMIAPGLSSYYY